MAPPEWNKSSITYKAPVDSSLKKADNFELFIECSGLTRDNVETSQGSEDTVEKTTFVLTPGPGTKGVQITWRFKEIATGNKKKFGVKFKRPANQKAAVPEGGVWTRNGIPTEPPKPKSRLGKESTTDTTWTPSEPLEDGTYDWSVRAQDVLGNWSEFATPWTLTIVYSASSSIAGYVRTSEGTGISDAVMSGLPGNPNTDADGYYTGTVDYGWSGIVTPTKTGYSFSPPSTSYSNVTANQSTNYTGTLQTITLPPPTISHLEPESGEQGETLELSCFGSNFVEGATVSFNPPTGITIDSVIFVDSLKLKAKNRIAADAPLEPRDVIVTNPDGQTDTLTGGFTVVSVTGVVEHSDVPTDFALLQSYPNPFNPSTTIEYHLPISGFVKLSVFDLLGREIAILVNEKKSVGKYRVTFYASNLPAGVYFYRMKAGQFQETRKLVLLK